MKIAVVLAIVLLTTGLYQFGEASPFMGRHRVGLKTIDQHFIIGGIEALRGAWPWQLSFQRYTGSSFSHFCGAVLISNMHALTAAHCIQGEQLSNLRVVAGLHDRSDLSGTVTRTVSRYVMHPSYDSAKLQNDIATMRLSEAINDNGFNIGYAHLPVDDSNDFSNTICVLTGWGRTNHAPNSPLPNFLQQANTGIITTSQCNSILSDLNNISTTPSMICAYDALHQKGACNGDSGGPMNCPSDLGYVVAGIASWVLSSQTYSCFSQYPSVYTRTSAYLGWIANNLP